MLAHGGRQGAAAILLIMSVLLARGRARQPVSPGQVEESAGRLVANLVATIAAQRPSVWAIIIIRSVVLFTVR
jgi:hypothetical protein